MKDWDEVCKRIEENEAIAEKFFELEKEILSILDFRGLFDVLLTKIETIFDLPAVWLSLVEECDAGRIIPLLEAEADLAPRLRRIQRRQFRALLGADRAPLLVNRNLERFSALFPPQAAWQMASLAVVPLSIDGDMIGSVNFADPDPQRFSPQKDTGFLRQLAVKLSLCLSNVTAHEKLSFLAYHDALTGLLNRRVMASVLQREVDRALRYRHPLTVVFIDVDDFKTVNDRYGHEWGDALLRRLGETLSGCSRSSDVVARFAGDEFVVILPESGAEAAQRLMDRVCRSAGQRPLQTPSGAVPLEISYGIASLEKGAAETPQQLLQRADQALYFIKRSKKPQTDRQPGRVIDFAGAAEKKGPGAQ